MRTVVDLTTWNRREHYDFFCKMEEPFYGVVVEIDTTIAYQESKRLGYSFFNYYLYRTLEAVNKTEAMRLRIEDGQVYLYDGIDASATIMRTDKTFGFSYVFYNEDYKAFNGDLVEEINRVQNTTGLMTRTDFKENIIHFSAVPFIKFSSISHARSFTYPDSCPKISVGKLYERNERMYFNVSVHVHHGLVDGYHLGQFIDELQRCLDQ